VGKTQALKNLLHSAPFVFPLATAPADEWKTKERKEPNAKRNLGGPKLFFLSEQLSFHMLEISFY